MKHPVITLLISMLSLLGCVGPAKVLPIENVGPNETAFVIPLEGTSEEQAKFESVEYLKSKKVVSKRIEVPVRQRDTGRGWWDYEWIPLIRVVRVNRSLVTREWSQTSARVPSVGQHVHVEWTDGKLYGAMVKALEGTSYEVVWDDGTGAAKVSADKVRSEAMAIAVESRESINFHVGVNLTALIMEEDAPTYLYYHTTTSLSEVVDQNVRGFLQGELSKAFGALSLEECKAQKGKVFAAVELLTKDHFKAYGITIQNVGSAGGLSYDDHRIQDAINETANADMQIEVARKTKIAQDQKNEQKVAAAKAERLAAEEFAKAKESQVAKIQLEIERIRAEAMFEAAKRWNGGLPSNVLPQGSPLLFGLDGRK